MEGFEYFDKHYLLSIDGAGFFSSKAVHCDHCCKKKHRNGKITYYHNMMVGVFVHPECREVFSLAPEPILKQDGSNKNDCKRNAGKRFLSDLCREHPRLKLIAVENGLVPNGPQIRLFIEKTCISSWAPNPTTMRHCSIRSKLIQMHRSRIQG